LRHFASVHAILGDNVKILAIDTSGKQAGAAIMDEYITIGEILINAQSGPKTWHHSEILMPAVDRLFALSGMELSDMDYVAYTSGPGSFTGIRIGAATALGLARSIKRPAVQVPTLDALAYNMLCRKEGALVEPRLDARREQVYGAVYRKKKSGELARLTDYFATPIEEALEQVKSVEKLKGDALGTLDKQSCNVIFLGDGADANKPTIQALYSTAQFALANSNRQRPASVALCAVDKIKSAPPPKAGTEPIDIIYIRDPQAVRNLSKT